MEQTGNIYIVEAQDDFKRVHKSIIENSAIDCETLGIYARIIVLGLKWNLNIKGLSTHLKLSDTRIRKAINLLEKEGYIVRTAVKQESGRFSGWDYKVFPYPVPEEQRSAAGKPTSQKSDTPKNGHDRLPTTPLTDMTENGEDNNNKLKEPIDLNKKETKENIESSAPSDEVSAKTDRISYKEIVDKYNDMFQGLLPQVTIMNSKRKAAIKARISECGLRSIDSVFNNILNSDFLTGNNDRNWKCDFDWIFKPTNYTKILEGNYNKKLSSPTFRKEYEGISFDTPYGKWIEWIKQTCPRVLMMKEVLTKEGYSKIKDFSVEEKKRRFTEMDKYPRLLKEYTDPITTFLNWK